MTLRRYILTRLAGLVPTLAIIMAASFLVIRMAPGSPFAGDRALSPEVHQALNARYGFDKPLSHQMQNYFTGLLHGDLGLSTKYPGRTVTEIIADGFPVTLALALCALAWALLLGVPAGILGALRQNSRWDHAAMLLALIGISIPSFVLGPLLISQLSLHSYLLPPAGWGSWRHVVLPAITLGTGYAAYIARLTRAGMLEVVNSDFIRTARAKGMPEFLIVRRHMLRGGLLPLVAYLGPAFAQMLVGSVVVEKIFATPGIGPHLVDATFNRDYFLVMGIVLMLSCFLLLLNLAVDVVHAIMDPRVAL